MGALIAGLIESGQIDGPDGDGVAEFELVAKLHSGSDLAELVGADVVVDVTAPAVSPDVVEFAVRHGLRVLVGTSGWSAERIATLRKAIGDEADAGVLIIPNFSLGSVLATRFAATAARVYDSVEIIEAHHRDKSDSPSGTAIRTAELIGAARAGLGPVVAPHSAQQPSSGSTINAMPSSLATGSSTASSRNEVCITRTRYRTRTAAIRMAAQRPFTGGPAARRR
jgi:4-hydroxy-tetrahydrodipicolinate reductase